MGLCGEHAGLWGEHGEAQRRGSSRAIGQFA